VIFHRFCIRAAAYAAMFLLWPVGIGAGVFEILTRRILIGREETGWPNQYGA
jgi:hypothetical protein